MRRDVLAALLLLASCSSKNSTPPIPFTPYVPPPIAKPYVDVPFLEETNHTTPEVEAGLETLVGVVLPPFSGFDRPSLVTPRGLGRHNGGALSMISIPSEDPDLIGAATTSALIWLIGPHAAYAIGADGQLTMTSSVPAGVTISGFASGTSNLYLFTDQGLIWSLGRAPTASVTAALEADGTLFLGGRNSVSAFPAPSGPALDAPRWTLTASDGLDVGVVRALVAGVRLPEPIDLLVIGEQGVAAYHNQGARVVRQTIALFGADRVPLDRPRSAVRASDGGFIVTTAAGAYRMMDRGRGPEWHVYGAERWLPSEDVRGVATDLSVADGPIWFATAAGLGWVSAERMTLEQKLASFVDRIMKRHDRDGAVADSHLTRRGDLSSNIPWDSDNDGSWTSYWLLSECYRYKVTGAADAKAHFDESLEAMLRLRDETGTDYFLSRSAIRKQGCILDDCDNPDDGKWFTSPDGAWWMKRDTSNDEVIAHVFMMGPSYDLCADDAQKERIRKHIGGIIGGIMDHGWQLVDPVTSTVTTYGQFDPHYVNVTFPGMLGDGGNRSVEILAGLTLAYYMTGEQRFLDGKRTLIEQHHYADNAVKESIYPVRPGDGCEDEMSTQAWFTLLRYESDPALRARWVEGWATSWLQLQVQQGSWWDLVNAVVGGAGAEVDRAARWLKLTPVDFIRWNMHNTQRHDLKRAPMPYQKQGQMIRSDDLIIPYDERPNDRWNTNQFHTDGGWGPNVEMDGADAQVPYWIGRYYGFITAAP